AATRRGEIRGGRALFPRAHRAPARRLRPHGLLVQSMRRQRLLHGNLDPEARPGRQGVEADPPAVRLDDAARDRQAEPGAGDALRWRAAAVEWLEDLFAVLRRDARA